MRISEDSTLLVHLHLLTSRVLDIDWRRAFKGQGVASVTSSTSRNKTRTIVKFKNGQFYLQHNSLEKDCPLVIALKAMGLEADQDIMQMIGGSGSEASLFIPSLEECSKLGVFSQDSALRYIGKAIKTSGGKQRRYRRDPREEVGEHTCATCSFNPT